MHWTSIHLFQDDRTLQNELWSTLKDCSKDLEFLELGPGSIIVLLVSGNPTFQFFDPLFIVFCITFIDELIDAFYSTKLGKLVGYLVTNFLVYLFIKV